MANIVTNRTVFNGDKRNEVHLTNDSDGTDETNVVKIDISSFSTFNGLIPIGLKVTKVIYSVSGFNFVKLFWERGNPEQDALVLSGRGELNFEQLNALNNTISGGSGSLLLSTDSAIDGASYDIQLETKKAYQSNLTYLLDGIPKEDLISVWSIRRLLKSFTDNLIRLRRDSDNTSMFFATENIGGDLDETGIASFLGAASGFYVRLQDQSEQNGDQVQAAASVQPEYITSGFGTRASLRFDEVAGNAMRAFSFTPSKFNEFTIFIVYKLGTTGVLGTIMRILFSSPSGSIVIRQRSSTSIQILDGARNILISGITAGSNNLLTFTRDNAGSIMSAYLNGNQASEQSETNLPDRESTGNVQISLGALNSGGSGPFDSDIPEAFIVSGILSATVRASFENDIINYFSI